MHRLGDELVPVPSPDHLILSIPFHTQARGRVVVCQSKRCVDSVSHECTWWGFNSFLIDMVVEIPRNVARTYLIRPACDEFATSILQSCCENKEETHRPQASLQGATSAAHELARPIDRGSIIEQYAVASTVCARVSIPDVLRSPSTGSDIAAGHASQASSPSNPRRGCWGQ
jgi:hypothetical protein